MPILGPMSKAAFDGPSAADTMLRHGPGPVRKDSKGEMAHRPG